MWDNSDEAASLSLAVESRAKLVTTCSARGTTNPYEMVRVPTGGGAYITVAVQGDTSKPGIVTYHDLGVNFLSFQAFFKDVDVRALLLHFCVYHINAPGQEPDAHNFPEGVNGQRAGLYMNPPSWFIVAWWMHMPVNHPKTYVYPTMDQLADQVLLVIEHFRLRSVIAFGVGFGGNILCRFTLKYPLRVDCLVVINCSSSPVSWMEWAWKRLVTRALRNNGMSHNVLQKILWYHLGQNSEERVPDIAEMYRFLIRTVNPYNLSLLLGEDIKRSALGIARGHVTLKVPVLNITGSLSPYTEHTVELNTRLDPQLSTWLKLSDCSMVLDEKPGKIAQAFRLFLQGEGFVAPFSPTKLLWFTATSRPCRSAVINIIENPISDASVC